MLFRALLLIALALPLPTLAQLRWMEGKDFTTLGGAATVEVRAGKIEIAEVFSYGCVFCYRAKDEIAKLQAALPADVYMTFVHASFRPEEGWLIYQRAWYAAQALGIGTGLHDRVFRAVWETHEIGLIDPTPGTARKPTLEDAARFYARAGKVKEADFLKVARSPAVDAQMKHADQLVKTWRIPGTPALVVNGRYLIEGKALSNWNDVRALVLYLVGLERQRMARMVPPPAGKP